jgi:hypothetical protein
VWAAHGTRRGHKVQGAGVGGSVRPRTDDYCKPNAYIILGKRPNVYAKLHPPTLSVS